MRAVSRKRAKAQREYLAARLVFLDEHPICQACQHAPSVDLDHRTNRSQSPAAFLDRDNWQALCRCCHDWKTTHPAEAVAAGLSVPGWQYRKGQT